MGIARLQKVCVLLHKSEREFFLSHLQELSILHITSADIEELSLGELSHLAKEAERTLFYIEDTLDELRPLVPSKGLLASFVDIKDVVPQEEYRDIVAHYPLQDVIRKVDEITSRISDLKAEANHLQGVKTFLEPWEGLSIPVEEIKGTEEAEVWAVVAQEEAFPSVEQELQDAVWSYEQVSVYGNRLYLLVTVHRSFSGVVKQVLAKHGVEIVDFSEISGVPKDELARIDKRLVEIERELSSLMEKKRELAISEYRPLTILRDHYATDLARYRAEERMAFSESACVIEGWVKTGDLKKLRSVVEKHQGELFEIEPGEGEQPPVELKNPKVIGPFELVTKLYGLPNPKEFDPSPLLCLLYTSPSPRD
mgnify:CR=1 FL=1